MSVMIWLNGKDLARRREMLQCELEVCRSYHEDPEIQESLQALSALADADELRAGLDAGDLAELNSVLDTADWDRLAARQPLLVRVLDFIDSLDYTPSAECRLLVDTAGLTPEEQHLIADESAIEELAASLLELGTLIDIKIII